jgi:hypothetical protein
MWYACAVRAKWASLGLRLVGPLLLVVVLLKLGDRERLLDVLGRANGWLLLVAALGNVLNIHLKVIRWQLLLSIRGHSYSTRAAWRATAPSMYIGLLTPGRVGDLLRVQYLRHDLNLPYAEGLAVIVMDRFCDLYVLLAFVVAGVMHFANVLEGDLGVLAWGAVAVTALAPAAFLVRGPVDRILELIYARFSKDGSGEGARSFLAALRGQLVPRLALAVPLTAASFLVNHGQGWLAARALGMQLSLLDVIFMLSITSLLSLIPISMSGVGVRELFLALVFPTLGLAASDGVAFGLAVFVVIYLGTIAIGFGGWQLAPPPFGEVRHPLTPEAESSSDGED